MNLIAGSLHRPAVIFFVHITPNCTNARLQATNGYNCTVISIVQVLLFTKQINHNCIHFCSPYLLHLTLPPASISPDTLPQVTEPPASISPLTSPLTSRLPPQSIFPELP